MPAAAAVAVAAWATAAGASVATVTLVGAITSAAVTGAIVGGVLGAVTSVISGGNILEGTLKGALIGGVVGGVAGGIGHLVAGTTAVAGAGVAPAGSQIAGGTVHGSIASGEAALTAANISTGAGAFVPPSSGLLESGVPPVPTGTPVAATPVVPPVSPTAPLSAEAQIAKIMAQSKLDVAAANAAALKNQMIMGGVQGLATSAGTVLAGKDKAESDKELADALAAREEAKKAGNLAGDYQPLFREYTLPPDWITSTESLYDKYSIKRTPTAKRGLLAGGMA